MRLLVLEDHPRFGALVRDHLRSAGYSVDLAASVAEFECMAQPGQHDLYIIDLGLPDGDGLDVVKALRAARSSTPILLTTARAAVPDRVKGLDCGADDYLVKPYNVSELFARVRALLRRPAELAITHVKVGQLTLDLATAEVRLEGKQVNFSPSERRLLQLLVRRLGAVVPKEVISHQVYGIDGAATPNAVEQLVSRLRRGLAQASPGIDLRTVRGVGYVLEASR